MEMGLGSVCGGGVFTGDKKAECSIRICLGNPLRMGAGSEERPQHTAESCYKAGHETGGSRLGGCSLCSMKIWDVTGELMWRSSGTGEDL